MRHRLILALVAAALLGGCSAHTSNMIVGNDMSYASLADQRQAALTVKVYPAMPAGAAVIAPVEAGRCHRSFTESTPKPELVTNDLKIAAYRLGANGIVDIKVEKVSALSSNCWYMFNGKATAIAVPE